MDKKDKSEYIKKTKCKRRRILYLSLQKIMKNLKRKRESLKNNQKN